ncbi:helix-turn-helix domain-containing protein [Streptomyces sp. NPDC001380]|uniref:helix-turn-helix domain-containing protein n=1 Tax=Streptomyces sp. NPDC001380 TaxID=3364566 RepID=UPI0036C5A498
MGAAGEAGPVNGPGGMLSAEARSLYLYVLGAGGRLPRRLVRTGDLPGGPDACRELEDLGLLVPDLDDPDALTAVDPQRLTVHLTSSWQRQALDLLARSVALPADLHELSEAYEGVGRAPEAGGPIEYVEGKVEINQRLVSLLEECSKEVLAAQPGGGRGSGTMKTAIDRDIMVLRRGVSRRTIYQPSARYSAPTRQYVELMTKEGAQFRTLAESFVRLIVIDRSVALIPVGADTSRAAFVRDEAVIGYLISTFEGLWERSIPFAGSADVPREVVSHLRMKIVRLMMQGINHRVIARNLGLSERTLARHIAELREDFGVETLFQLGWKMAQDPYLLDGPGGEFALDPSL